MTFISAVYFIWLFLPLFWSCEHCVPFSLQSLNWVYLNVFLDALRRDGLGNDNQVSLDLEADQDLMAQPVETVTWHPKSYEHLSLWQLDPLTCATVFLCFSAMAFMLESSSREGSSALALKHKSMQGKISPHFPPCTMRVIILTTVCRGIPVGCRPSQRCPWSDNSWSASPGSGRGGTQSGFRAHCEVHSSSTIPSKYIHNHLKMSRQSLWCNPLWEM